MLDPVGVLRFFDGRNDFGEGKGDVIVGGGIEVNLLHFTIQIAGRAIEVLAFPLIHV